MAIPSTWNSVDDLPEWAKGLHEEGHIVEGEDGKLHLEATGLSPKEKVDDFRTKNITLQKQLETLQEQMKGGKTAAEVEQLYAQMQELRDRAEAGDDEERVQELMKKRLVEVPVGDRTIAIERKHKAALEAYLREQGKQIGDLTSKSNTVLTELKQERLTGIAQAAYLKLDGHKPAALPTVVDYYEKRAVMGDDFQYYMPDPEAPRVDGEPPPPLIGEDGKPVGIAQHLQQVAEKGDFAGVWFDEAGGPPSTRLTKPGHRSQPGEVHGVSRIVKGLRKQQGRAAA